jgi:MFS family permease
VNAAPVADARRLGAFWFGIQVVWTAVLGVVLQDRASGLSPQPVLAYAELAAAGAAVASIVQVVAGIFSDRARVRAGDRRAFYRIGVLLAIPAIVVLPAVTSLGALWSAMLLLQVGMNVAGGPYQAIVSDYLPPERVGRASSWMSIYQFSGSVVGILLTTQLRGVALGVALAACLAAGWLATDLYLRRQPRSPAIAAAPLRFDANVRTVLASRAFINLGFYTLFGFLFFFVRESLGAPDARTTTGILILAFTIAGVIGAAVAGRPADRLDKRLVVTVACIAIAISVGAFAAAPTVAVSLVCAIASGVAWGAFFTADWSIAYAVLPRDAMAKAMGVWNLALAVPQVAAPAITGPLVAALDARRAGLGPRVALICVIVEFAIGTAWLWRLRLSRTRDAPRETIPP